MIQEAEFVAIVGTVGSGKTSLLLGILKEMISGAYDSSKPSKIAKHGKIAYVPQESFLINDTVKNNIIFGKELDENKLQKCITLCELEDDLKILKAGIYTQIGERGINLSGGQKQRISLARALYSDSDIYVIDDALSALDA
jgi:ABC-type bacteriocin/lantibiotic exporter with double-glycine peptidase domain